MSTNRNTILPSYLTTCYQANVPSTHRSRGFQGDLVLYLTSEYEPNENHEAWAVSEPPSLCFLTSLIFFLSFIDMKTYCAQDSLYGRPIAGQIHFNTRMFGSDKNYTQQYFLEVISKNKL